MPASGCRACSKSSGTRLVAGGAVSAAAPLCQSRGGADAAALRAPPCLRAPLCYARHDARRRGAVGADQVPNEVDELVAAQRDDSAGGDSDEVIIEGRAAAVLFVDIGHTGTTAAVFEFDLDNRSIRQQAVDGATGDDAVII